MIEACKTDTIPLTSDESYFETIIFKAMDIQGNYGPKVTFLYLDSVQLNDPRSSPFLAFKILCYKTSTYINFNHLDSAKASVDKMLPLLNSLAPADKIPDHYAKAYFSLSDVNFHLKNYLEAYKWLYLGKKIGTNILSNCTISEYNYRMGMILFKQENYLSAAHFFNDSYKQSADCGNNFEAIYRQQELINNTGLSYYKANHLDAALLYYHSALHFLKVNALKYKQQQKFFEVAEGVILGNLGQVYEKKGDYKKAIEYLEKSILINDSNTLESKDADLQRIHLAEIELKTKDYEKLKANLENLKLKLDTNSNSLLLVNYYRIASGYEAAKGNNAYAYELLKKNNHLNNKLLDSDKALTSTNINEQLKFIESQESNSSLLKSNELKTIYLVTTGIIITMGICLFGLIYFSWKLSKKNLETLKLLNDKINQQREELQKKSIEKDKILRIVAHDLRNPIGGIFSLSKIMQQDDLNFEEKETIGLIENASKDALELINELLEFTEDVKDNPSLEKLNIHLLLTQVTSLLKFKINEKKQHLILKLETDNDTYILGSREKFSRVLSNLIVNASKFSHADKVIQVSLNIVDGNKALIKIKDEGIGIPSDKADSIFESFSSFNRKGTDEEKSYGMGLSICKQIVESHNGKIWFESSENGTTFFVQLPLV